MWKIMEFTNKISGKVIFVGLNAPYGLFPTMGEIAKNVMLWKPEIFDTKEKAEAFIKTKWNICSDCGGTVCDCCYTSAEMERMGWKQPQ
jgi:hypothetical protein